MALKVISSYSPTPLKVTKNTGNQVTYNPQKTAPVQTTYNPQTTATPAQINAAKVSQSWATEQATRLRQEQEAAILAAAVQRKRLSDAKNNELRVTSGNIAKNLFDKASFGELRRQRGSRELAIRYYNENEQKWAGYLMAKQRNYESEGARLKDWVMQADNEAEYNKRVADANAWLEKEYKVITDDINDFTKTQKELATFGEQPLTGKVASLGRMSKSAISAVTSKSWQALVWSASQPQRVLNTGKNFFNPNNLRLYDDGGEAKGGITGRGSNIISTAVDQLKKSYNASQNQRILGRSKVDEAAQLAILEASLRRQRVNGGKNIFGTSSSRGFLRDGEIDRVRIKYGDDVANILADPLNFFAAGWAGKGIARLKTSDFATKLKSLNKSQIDRLYEFAGKNKTVTNFLISRAAKGGDRVDSLARWFKSGVGDYNQDRYSKFFNDRVPQFNKTRSMFDMAAQKHRDRIKDMQLAKAKIKPDLERAIASWNATKEFYDAGSIKRFENMSDRMVDAIYRYRSYFRYADGKNPATTMKKAMSFEGLDDLKLTEKEKRKVIKQAYRMQATYDKLFRSNEAHGLRYDYRQGYNPHKVDKNYSKYDFTKRKGRPSYTKSQTNVTKLTPDEARKGAHSRLYSQMFSENPAGARATELTKLNKNYNSLIEQSYKKLQKSNQFKKAALQKQLTPFERLVHSKQPIKPEATSLEKFEQKLNKAGKYSPMKIWRKSVLALNPAWYVNNAAWNVPASVSAASGDVFSEYGKLLTSRKYWKQAVDSVPEGVTSNIAEKFGGGRLASKIEDTARLATFLALRKKGYADADAIKQVNRWLFDYQTKNWERPIKGILPFWQWQKNIVRLGTTMALHSPRSAKTYSELYKQFYQRPYDQLPQEKQEYTDPETGKTITYDPRKFYKGKAKIGNKWYGLPFFAVNPDNALNAGINPALSAFGDFASSTDYAGNSNTNRKGWTILGERFPQINLGRAFVNRNNQDINQWFAQSGNSKWQQGYDKYKSNYKEGLDNNRKFYNTLKSFFGVPRGVAFDKLEFDTKKRLTDFNNEFFKVDWAAKEDVSYADAQKEKEALAKKYGFDLQKDIYDGYWSKYDTATTANTKRLKREAAKFNSPDTGFWGDYFKLPSGSLTSASQRRPFLIGKFNEWKRDHTFAKNPYYKLPKNGEINPFVLKGQENQSIARRADGKFKYQRKLEYDRATKTGDWSWFETNGREKTGFSYDGKYFKSADSMAKYKIGKLWAEYYALSTTDERKAYLAAHPELPTYPTPKNADEWNELRAKLRQVRNAKTSKIAGFDQLKNQIIQNTTNSIRTSFGTKRRLKFK